MEVLYDLSIIVCLGGFETYDFLKEELLVLLDRAIFCSFLFFVGIERKHFDLVQSLHITYELRRNF